MSTVTYGIIGFGGIAENRMVKEGFGLDSARFSPPSDVRLKGVTDANPQRRKAAEAYGLLWYPSAEKLLADKEIEAVYIAAPNSLHAAIAQSALSAGKHVLLEKPMTNEPAAAEVLRALAKKKSLSLSVNLMMKKNTLNIAARERILRGDYGDIDHIVTHMEFLYGSTPEEAASWRCSKPEELGGPIGDVASHCLYMAEFLLDDRITEVRCSFTPPSLPLAVENGAVIEFTTAGGKSGTARAAFNQPRGSLAATIENLGYEVYCSNAVLYGIGTLFQLSGHADEPAAIRLETVRDGNREVYYPEGDDTGGKRNIYRAQIQEHAESIRTGKLMDGSDGLHNLKLVAACYDSASRGGKAVRV